MLVLWRELPATPGGSLTGAGGLVGVLSLAGTVCGLEYLGDGIDHLFLILVSVLFGI